MLAEAGADAAAESRLQEFVALLLRWNQTINLIARGDTSRIWDRHVADSLQLLPLLRPSLLHPWPARAIDLGSGGGFPGLVLSLAGQIPFDLIEADHRKAAFLREAARITGAPATIHAARIATVSLPPAPIVTARALANLPELLALAAPKLAPGGVLWALKGASAQAELTAAQTEWHMRCHVMPSRTQADGVILRMDEITRARHAPPIPGLT